jgi:hypothetical protein
MKKAMAGLLISNDGEVFFNCWYSNVRHYPRTKWVVRAERQFRRLWRESQRKSRRIQELEERLAYFRSIGLW